MGIRSALAFVLNRNGLGERKFFSPEMVIDVGVGTVLGWRAIEQLGQSTQQHSVLTTGLLTRWVALLCQQLCVWFEMENLYALLVRKVLPTSTFPIGPRLHFYLVSSFDRGTFGKVYVDSVVGLFHFYLLCRSSSLDCISREMANCHVPYCS